MLRMVSKKLLGIPSPSPPLQTLPRLYHQNVIDHYNNPRNVGSFDKNDPNVGTGLVGAPACGDVMKLQIKIDEDSGKIVDACFKTFGCGSAIASSSVATEWVKGKSMDEVLTIKNTGIMHQPFESNAQVLVCSHLVLRAMYKIYVSGSGRNEVRKYNILMPKDAVMEIAKHLSLPPVKLHCSMLAEDAIKAAVKDAEAKRGKMNGNSKAADA
ncbi:hypothetical protein Golob_023073 [Gossypium lobatum]|uniref:NIF system FeS cluster assembly NifU N-terminal domain-containing protein n=1 Tax=Gossypium lobatum TaxID=34289 RepID=A0A7J8LIH7_9ROSI|nr:hypothetical protein [Gossypium lobatum]